MSSASSIAHGGQIMRNSAGGVPARTVEIRSALTPNGSDNLNRGVRSVGWWLCVVLLIGLLGEFSGSVRGQDAGETALPGLRRVFVPAGQPDTWPAGDWRPLPLEEFEKLTGRLRTPQSPSPAAAIELAEYTGTLAGDRLVQGNCLWEVRRLTGQPVWLSLASLQLPLSQLVWQDDRPVVWGTTEQGATLLWVTPKSGQVTGHWTLQGRKAGQGVEFQLSLPQATLSRLSLKIPDGFELKSSAGDVLPGVATSEPGWRLWQVQLGQETKVRLTMSRRAKQMTPQPVLLTRRDLTYSIRRSAVRMQAEFTLEVLEAPVREVVVSLERDLQLLSVSYGDDVQVPWKEDPPPANASTRLVRISLPDAVQGQGLPLRLQAITQLGSASTWMIPQPMLVGAMWLEGQATLLIPAPLEAVGFRADGYRQIEFAPSTAEGERVVWKQWKPDASLGIVFHPPRLEATLREFVHVQTDNEPWLAVAHLEWQARSGQSFSTSCQIPEGWEVTDVKPLVPTTPGDLVRWEVVTQRQRQRWLVVHFLESLSADHPKRIRVNARRTLLGVSQDQFKSAGKVAAKTGKATKGDPQETAPGRAVEVRGGPGKKETSRTSVEVVEHLVELPLFQPSGGTEADIILAVSAMREPEAARLPTSGTGTGTGPASAGAATGSDGAAGRTASDGPLVTLHTLTGFRLITVADIWSNTAGGLRGDLWREALSEARDVRWLLRTSSSQASAKLQLSPQDRASVDEGSAGGAEDRSARSGEREASSGRTKTEGVTPRSLPGKASSDVMSNERRDVPSHIAGAGTAADLPWTALALRVAVLPLLTSAGSEQYLAEIVWQHAGGGGFVEFALPDSAELTSVLWGEQPVLWDVLERGASFHVAAAGSAQAAGAVEKRELEAGAARWTEVGKSRRVYRVRLPERTADSSRAVNQVLRLEYRVPVKGGWGRHRRAVGLPRLGVPVLECELVALLPADVRLQDVPAGWSRRGERGSEIDRGPWRSFFLGAWGRSARSVLFNPFQPSHWVSLWEGDDPLTGGESRRNRSARREGAESSRSGSAVGDEPLSTELRWFDAWEASSGAGSRMRWVRLTAPSAPADEVMWELWHDDDVRTLRCLLAVLAFWVGIGWRVWGTYRPSLRGRREWWAISLGAVGLALVWSASGVYAEVGIAASLGLGLALLWPQRWLMWHVGRQAAWVPELVPTGSTRSFPAMNGGQLLGVVLLGGALCLTAADGLQGSASGRTQSIQAAETGPRANDRVAASGGAGIPVGTTPLAGSADDSRLAVADAKPAVAGENLELVLIPVDERQQPAGVMPVVYVSRTLWNQLQKLGRQQATEPAYLLRSAEYQVALDDRPRLSWRATYHIYQRAGSQGVVVPFPLANVHLSGPVACTVDDQPHPVLPISNLPAAAAPKTPGFAVELSPVAKPLEKTGEKPDEKRLTKPGARAGEVKGSERLESTTKPAESLRTESEKKPAATETATALADYVLRKVELRFFSGWETDGTVQTSLVGLPAVVDCRSVLSLVTAPAAGETGMGGTAAGLSAAGASKITAMGQGVPSRGNERAQVLADRTDPVELELGPARELRVRWTNKPLVSKQQPFRTPAQVQTTVSTLCEVHLGYAFVRTRFDFRVLEGQIEQLEWTLPAGFVVHQVQSPEQGLSTITLNEVPGAKPGPSAVRPGEISSGKRQMLLEFPQPRSGEFTVSINGLLTWPRDVQPAVVSMPVVQMVSPKTAGGNWTTSLQQLAFHAPSDLRLEVTPSQVEKTATRTVDDFLATYLGEGPRPQTAFVVMGPQEWRLSVQPVAAALRAEVWWNVRLRQEYGEWQAVCDVEPQRLPMYQYRLKVDSRCGIQSVSVLEDKAERLLRWARTGDEVVLFLNDRATRPQTVRLQGTFPLTKGGATPLAEVLFLDAVNQRTTLDLYADADLQVILDEAGRLAEWASTAPTLPAAGGSASPSLTSPVTSPVTSSVTSPAISPVPTPLSTPLATPLSSALTAGGAQGMLAGATRVGRFQVLQGTRPLQVQVEPKRVTPLVERVQILEPHDTHWDLRVVYRLQFPTGTYFTQPVTLAYDAPWSAIPAQMLSSPEARVSQLARSKEGEAATPGTNWEVTPLQPVTDTWQITCFFPRIPLTADHEQQLPLFDTSFPAPQRDWLLIAAGSGELTPTSTGTVSDVAQLPDRWWRALGLAERRGAWHVWEHDGTTWKIARGRETSAVPETRVMLAETRLWISAQRPLVGQWTLWSVGDREQPWSVVRPSSCRVTAILVDGVVLPLPADLHQQSTLSFPWPSRLSAGSTWSPGISVHPTAAVTAEPLPSAIKTLPSAIKTLSASTSAPTIQGSVSTPVLSAMAKDVPRVIVICWTSEVPTAWGRRISGNDFLPAIEGCEVEQRTVLVTVADDVVLAQRRAWDAGQTWATDLHRWEAAVQYVSGQPVPAWGMPGPVVTPPPTGSTVLRPAGSQGTEVASVAAAREFVASRLTRGIPADDVTGTEASRSLSEWRDELSQRSEQVLEDFAEIMPGSPASASTPGRTVAGVAARVEHVPPAAMVGLQDVISVRSRPWFGSFSVPQGSFGTPVTAGKVLHLRVLPWSWLQLANACLLSAVLVIVCWLCRIGWLLRWVQLREGLCWTVMGLFWWTCLSPSGIGFLLTLVAGLRAFVLRVRSLAQQEELAAIPENPAVLEGHSSPREPQLPPVSESGS